MRPDACDLGRPGSGCGAAVRRGPRRAVASLVLHVTGTPRHTVVLFTTSICCACGRLPGSWTSLARPRGPDRGDRGPPGGDGVHAGGAYRAARELLELTDEPVARMSQGVGYLGVSYFRRLFRRATGVAPSEYRRRFGILARVGRPEEVLPTGQRARIRSTPSR
ncbi:helix-turn-helix domain-containing protein [Streptomyces hydrogenans]|uniref:helix-turn-helix domain-containing protein n=1 Tax=Streptomyces hydrogenans TaxID=1873719 RepID=UPI00382E4184